MTDEQKIISTLAWIADVKRDGGGYLINEEIFDGVATLAEEYKRMTIAEARQNAARARSARGEHGGKAGRPRRKSTKSLSSAALYKRARRAAENGQDALAEKMRTQAQKKRQQEKILVDKSVE